MNFQPGQMIPQYENKRFTDIYSTIDAFLEDYNTCGIPTIITEDSIKTLFFLLYARYGNNPIANSDENQFKYKLFSIIFQYGPTWEKRLEIQGNLRELSIEDAAEGARSIYNHAYNPSTGPSTNTTDELNFINDQNVSKFKKSKTNAAMDLWELLKVDVSENFLIQFRKLFIPIVQPQATYIFTTDVIEEE